MSNGRVWRLFSGTVCPGALRTSKRRVSDFRFGSMLPVRRAYGEWLLFAQTRRLYPSGVDVNRTFLIAGAIPAIRDRDVLPSRSRLNVADKSQRRRDLWKLGSRREAFERRPDCGLRVGVAPS